MQQPTITFTVQQGPQRGQRFSLAKDSIIIGRVVGSDVVISDPEVSRRHASITWERGQPVIRDLGSTNGTFVNGVRLTGPQALRDGDTIGLGQVQLGFQCPALARARPAVARPAPPPPVVSPVEPPAYAPPPFPPVEARRGPGGLSWLALGLFGLAIVILLVTAAIGAYLYTQRGKKVAGVPTVFINSPASGSQVPVGQEVIVQAMATDSKGVTQVELLVNGVLYHSDVSPNPQGQSPFISRQSWWALAPGTYTLMVKAYNAAGGVTESAAIIVNVTGAATPGPGQPTATPGEPTVTSTPAPGTPTATWTPVIIVVTDTPTPTPTGCTLDAAFLADVTVPDGTVFSPGERINKIWRIRNSGSCPWQSGYTWVFVSGDQMGAPPSQPVPATAAGANVDIGVTMDAPGAPGTYTGYWRMKSPGGEVFGQTCSVQIVVPAPATATPTVTPTPTATPTQLPPVIEFTVDDNSITAGSCTTLRVHIENVQAAYLSGAEYANSGVPGPHWSGPTCPASTTTYTLHVVKLDASTQDKTVTVNVTPAGPTTVTLTGQAALDGFRANNGGGNNAIDIRVGNGTMVGSPAFELVIRGFMSFDLSGLPAGATIQSAQLRFYQVDIKGDPYGKLPWFHLKHVDYGASLESGDYDTPILHSANLAKHTSPGEWYEVSGTTMRDWIQDDLNNHRPRAQFRLQFSPETDSDGSEDFAYFESGDNSFSTGNVPRLIITYTP